MMLRSKDMPAPPARNGGPSIVLALTALLGIAACDSAQDGSGAGAGQDASGGSGQQTSAGGGQARSGGAGSRTANAQPAAQRSDEGEGRAGDVSRQAAANVEETIELATFSPTVAPTTADPQGRLPAEGDLTIYVPDSTLFPGSARLDPGIENPYAGNAEAIAAGRRHFNAFNCAGCHAPLGGGGMGPPLSDEEWIHGGEPAQIFLSIMHGRPEGMPAWSSMLPRRTVWELVAYIETLDEIDNYATELGFDAEHATSTSLESRSGTANAGEQPNSQ